MPLFGTPKKPLQKRGFGQALEKGWPGNKPIYHLAITNEVFDDYEEYVNRAIMYKLQIWSCQYSGKDNMTYEQALECEKEQKIKHLFKFYPRYILRHICYMIHHCKRGETVQDLVQRISKFFEYNFVEGEELFCELDTTISVVLRRILLKKAKYYVEDPNFPPFSTPLYITDAEQHQIEVFHQTKAQEHYYDYDPSNIGFGTQGKLYEVEILSNNSPFENRVIVVYYSVLLRKQISLVESPEKLTQWIMENTFYDESSGCIRLKQEFVDYFKLEPHQSRTDKIPTFQKNLEEEMEDITKFKKGLVRSVNDLKYHHVDKFGKVMTDIKEIEQSLRATSSSSFEPSQSNNVSQKNHVHIGMNGTEPKNVQPAVNPLLLPKEDGTILDEYITSRSKTKSDSNFPKPHYDYVLTHVESIPEALNVFNFLNVFRAPLKILPFTFDEFQHSLECKSENNPLLRSILSAMLLFLFFDKGANKQDVNRSIYKMKKLYNQVRTKDQRIINLPSRKQVINREATVYISQVMPIILLREYWRAFMSHEMIDIPEEEFMTNTATKESNGTTEASVEDSTTINQTTPIEEGIKQSETNTQNESAHIPTNKVEESNQEPHPSEQQIDSAATVESTTPASTITSNPTTNLPESTPSNHIHENNHTNVKEEKTDDATNIKQETTDEQKPVAKPPNLIVTVMKFIKDDNYHNESEINFFTHLESNAKVYILSKLTEQCIQSATIREYIDEGIERMRLLKRQRNIENNEDIEKQKEEASKQEADESSNNNNRRFTSEEVRTRKVEREKNYQTLVNQHVIRAKHLGFDRFFNRYWFFPSFTGVLFVEPCSPFRDFSNSSAEDPVDTRPWGYYSSKKEIEKLIAVLDSGGFREKKLLNSLQKNKEEIFKQVELRCSVVSKFSSSTEASAATSDNAMKDEEAPAAPSLTDTTTNTSTISNDTEEPVENKMAVDADSTDSPSSKKRKHMDDSQSDTSEISSNSAQPNTKKTKTEQTLSEQAKNIKVFIPSPQSFAPDAFLHYKNTLEEIIPQDSECFIVETEEDEEDE